MGVKTSAPYPKVFSAYTSDQNKVSGGKIIGAHVVGDAVDDLLYTVPNSTVFMLSSIGLSAANRRAGYTLMYVYAEDNPNYKLLSLYLGSGAVGTEAVANTTLIFPVPLPIFLNIYGNADAFTTYDIFITGFEKPIN